MKNIEKDKRTVFNYLKRNSSDSKYSILNNSLWGFKNAPYKNFEYAMDRLEEILISLGQDGFVWFDPNMEFWCITQNGKNELHWEEYKESKMKNIILIAFALIGFFFGSECMLACSQASAINGPSQVSGQTLIQDSMACYTDTTILHLRSYALKISTSARAMCHDQTDGTVKCENTKKDTTWIVTTLCK